MVGELDYFAGYVVDTEETPIGLIVAVGVAVAVMVVFAAPFGCWSKELRQRKRIPAAREDRTIEPEAAPEKHNVEPTSRDDSTPPEVVELSVFHNEHLNAMKQLGREDVSSILDESTARMASQQPRAESRSTMSSNTRQLRRHPGPPVSHIHKPHDANSALDRMSNTPSAATTSRMYGATKSVGENLLKSRMPWRHGHVLSRPVRMKRSLNLERQSIHSGFQKSEVASLTAAQRQQLRANALARPGNASDAAGSVLSGQASRGEEPRYERRYKDAPRSVASRSVVTRSVSSRSVLSRSRSSSFYDGSDMGSCIGSIMPPLHPDAVSPEDAADAGDPGRIPPSSSGYHEGNHNATDTTGAPTLEQPDSGSAQMSTILDLADPDFEFKRLMALALPSTISAIADPLFRIALVAIITRYVDTESMVAYLLVMLFLRLSMDEISGAISDAQSSFLQFYLVDNDEESFYQAGRVIQLSIFTQVLVGVPVLVVWYFFMDNVVLWLIDDAPIAELASDYTRVIMIDYVVKAASRSFMLPYYLTSQAQFEAKIDLVAVVLCFAAILIIEAKYDNADLIDIAWVQVTIGILRTAAKVAFVLNRGYHIPYKQGLFRAFSLTDSTLVFGFLMQALPLFMGSLLELGEWEILTLLISHLGGPEVVAWALMGMIWEIFVGLTEGLGEAASVRVSYYLSEGLSRVARRLTNKVVFLSFVSVLFFTSLFLIIAPNVAVLLTDDSTLQHLFFDLVGLASVASVSMTFSQIYWSLAGAQGRFALASATILFCRWFITLPMASVCIYRYRYDLRSIAGTVAIGNAVAAFVLAFSVYRSDWSALSAQFRNDPGQVTEDDEEFDVDEYVQEDDNDISRAETGADVGDDSSSHSSDSESESSVGFLAAMSVTERLNDDGSVFSERTQI